jgi:hypothetical protein
VFEYIGELTIFDRTRASTEGVFEPFNVDDSLFLCGLVWLNASKSLGVVVESSNFNISDWFTHF